MIFLPSNMLQQSDSGEQCVLATTPAEGTDSLWRRRGACYLLMLDERIAKDARLGVIVADGGRARFLTANSRGTRKVLTEVDYLERPNLHVTKRDMTSDLTGRVFNFASAGKGGRFVAARHGADSDFDPHLAEVQRFAKAVARRIDLLVQQEPISDLVLIVEPRFLGQLRPCLSAPTRARVSREISRDYVHANAARIQRTAFAKRPAGMGRVGG
jgi:protein required for attachment to host cells